MCVECVFILKDSLLNIESQIDDIYLFWSEIFTDSTADSLLTQFVNMYHVSSSDFFWFLIFGFQ